MKLTIAKIVMRIIGTLAGLLGLGVLCFAPFMVYQSITDQNLWMIFFVAFPLAVSVYLINVAYLVWFKFSPLAVRHICGAIGFYAIMKITKLFEPSRYAENTWMPFAFLGCLVAVYIVYRFASNRLSRLLFPESFSSIKS